MPATTGQHKQLKTSHSSPSAVTTSSGTITRSNVTRNDENNTFEDDDNNDCEMALMDGVSYDADNNTLQNDVLAVNGIAPENAYNSNFARTFFNNTRRRMSSGLVLSYNFLKGASNNRRDST